jgi:hypothetical protein
MTISRRTLLGGAAAVALTPALATATATPALAAITQSRLGNGGYRVPTTRRTGYTPYGAGHIGTHTGEVNWTYNDGFYPICNAWIDSYHSILRWQTGGAVGIWFVGLITVTGGSGSSNHVAGNAVDITAIYHTDGNFADCNYSHFGHAGAVHNRRYAALAWSARKHMPEVGIVGTESSHSNHVHAGRYKNGSASLLLSHFGRSWDAWLVQYTCKVFMGAPIALDGNWGNQTETYYLELMRRLGYAGRNPFGSTAHLQDLAHTITAYGVIGAAI